MTDSSASTGLEDQIDFSVAGVLVRSIFDPAKTGHTTGNVVRQPGRSYALLRLKSGEIGQFQPEGTGHADFYPHQFKPVLKLVSSTGGRILIADEVGLGKTIEAIYVWKELQARFGCRRLLVVCPSMLQQKWQSELRNRFAIDANIVDAKELLQQLERAADDTTASFVSIGSIESLRARKPKTEDPERSGGPRQLLAAFLADHESSDASELLDLVIIDSAL